MQPSNPGTTPTTRLERYLAVAGAVICLIITIPIWRSISAEQIIWPLPGLYFMEMVTVSIVSAVAFVRGDSWGRLFIWGAVGIYIVFSILGAFSVGFFYLPVAIIYGMLAIRADVRNKQAIAKHFGVCVIAGITQTTLMFAAVYLLP